MRNAVLVACLLLGAACSPSVRRPAVVVSTTLLARIVEAVGGGTFAVQTVAPALACPGQFDIRPTDVVAASQARLLINQGWEPWFPSFAAAVENATRETKVKPWFVTATTRGNWMIPDVHKAAANEIAGLLGELLPESTEAFRRNASRYATEVDSAAAATRALFSGQAMPAVIASDKQAPFLSWLGFRVVRTYGAMEDCSAQDLSQLAKTALDSSATLVVDNLQSGPEAGLPLAQALKVKHVTLTNFPLDSAYVPTLLANARQLKAATTE